MLTNNMSRVERVVGGPPSGVGTDKRRHRACQAMPRGATPALALIFIGLAVVLVQAPGVQGYVQGHNSERVVVEVYCVSVCVCVCVCVCACVCRLWVRRAGAVVCEMCRGAGPHTHTHHAHRSYPAPLPATAPAPKYARCSVAACYRVR